MQLRGGATKVTSFKELSSLLLRYKLIDRMNELQTNAIQNEASTQRALRRWGAFAALKMVLWQLNAICVLLVGVSVRLAVREPRAATDAPYSRQQRFALGVPVALVFALQLTDRVYLQNRHHYSRGTIVRFPGHVAVLCGRVLLLLGNVAVCALPIVPVHLLSIQAALAVAQLGLLHTHKFACAIHSEHEHPLEAPLGRALDGLRLKALRYRERAWASREAQATETLAATAIQASARGQAIRWAQHAASKRAEHTPVPDCHGQPTGEVVHSVGGCAAAHPCATVATGDVASALPAIVRTSRWMRASKEQTYEPLHPRLTDVAAVAKTAVRPTRSRWGRCSSEIMTSQSQPAGSS